VPPAQAALRHDLGTFRPETRMDDEVFNLSLRKFLKMVGVSSQRDIEQAVSKALQDQAIAGNESFPATMTLDIPGLKLQVNFKGEIRLQ
jgi:hypothetical protein